jgi:hypothetical protein
MTIDQRNQACREAAQAFRNAWALMDAALGYDASSDIGESNTLLDIIQILDQPEYLGAPE